MKINTGRSYSLNNNNNNNNNSNNNNNNNFQNNQGRFFKNLEGKEKRTKPPTAEDATSFWKGIWSAKVEHKRDVESKVFG